MSAVGAGCARFCTINGSHLAFTQDDPHQGLIRVLSLAGGEAREVNVKGREHLAELNWAADGGLFVNGVGMLLYVDLEGSAQALLPQNPTNWGFGHGIPSPDGRYLAILGHTTYSNVWLLENF